MPSYPSKPAGIAELAIDPRNQLRIARERGRIEQLAWGGFSEEVAEQAATERALFRAVHTKSEIVQQPEPKKEQTKTMIRYTMRRDGEVHLTVKAGSPNFCGTNGSVLAFRYSLRVECGSQLDGRGFTFDQTKVESVMAQYVVTESCEMLAHNFATRIVELVKKENALCVVHELALKISPHPFAASVECTMSPAKGHKHL